MKPHHKFQGYQRTRAPFGERLFANLPWIVLAVAGTFWLSVAYVAVHFIAKFW